MRLFFPSKKKMREKPINPVASYLVCVRDKHRHMAPPYGTHSPLPASMGRARLSGTRAFLEREKEKERKGHENLFKDRAHICFCGWIKQQSKRPLVSSRSITPTGGGGGGGSSPFNFLFFFLSFLSLYYVLGLSNLNS